MKKYEGLFIFSPQVTEEQLKAQEKGVCDLITKFNGKPGQITELGRKTLGYELKKFRDGNLVLFDFEMEAQSVEPFRKALELNLDVFKYTLTIKDPRLEKKIIETPATPEAKATPETPKAEAPATPEATATPETPKAEAPAPATKES